MSKTLGKIVILNRKERQSWPKHDRRFYCGRGSALGNEFSMIPSAAVDDGCVVKDRDEACDRMKQQYLRYLRDKKELYPKTKEIREEFRNIFKALKAGKTVGLECYCLNLDESKGVRKGQRCHTLEVKDLLERTLREYPDKSMDEILKEWESAPSPWFRKNSKHQDLEP